MFIHLPVSMTFSQHKVLLGVIVLLHWKCKAKKKLPPATAGDTKQSQRLLHPPHHPCPDPSHQAHQPSGQVAIVTALVIVIDLCIFFNRDLPVAKENRFFGDDVVARMGHRVLTNLYRVASKPAVILSTSYLSCKECTGCATEVNK